jgi:hypothetical protein
MQGQLEFIPSFPTLTPSREPVCMCHGEDWGKGEWGLALAMMTTLGQHSQKRGSRMLCVYRGVPHGGFPVALLVYNED